MLPMRDRTMELPRTSSSRRTDRANVKALSSHETLYVIVMSALFLDFHFFLLFIRIDEQLLNLGSATQQDARNSPNNISCEVVSQKGFKRIKPRLNPEPPLSSHSVVLANRLIYYLNKPTTPGTRIQDLGLFFEFVPYRLGHNRALDDAVRCICIAYSSFLCDKSSVLQDRGEYCQALRSLRACLQDEKIALSSETLCAAMILRWYEVGTLNFIINLKSS
jgi:hypothetical protein